MNETDDLASFKYDICVTTAVSMADDGFDIWKGGNEKWNDFRWRALSGARRAIAFSRIPIEEKTLMLETYEKKLDQLKAEWDVLNPRRPSIWERLWNFFS
jgi:hypothetical protein